MASSAPPRRPSRLHRFCRRALVYRQLYSKVGAFPFPAFHLDPAPVLREYAVGYREAEARPLIDGLGCKERVEYIAYKSFGDAGAVVRDHRYHLFPFRLVFGLQGYPPPSSAGFDRLLGVDKDIYYRLLDLLDVNIRQRDRSVVFHHFHVLRFEPVGPQFERLVQHLVDILEALIRHLLPRKTEETLYYLSAPLRGLMYLFELFL